MTAIQMRTVRVYIADFTKCGSKAAFYRILAAAFRLRLSLLNTGIPAGIAVNSDKFWRELIEQISSIASDMAANSVPVKVRISGLENVYSCCPDEVGRLIHILRAAEERYPYFHSDIKIGNAVWHCR